MALIQIPYGKKIDFKLFNHFLLGRRGDMPFFFRFFVLNLFRKKFTSIQFDFKRGLMANAMEVPKVRQSH